MFAAVQVRLVVRGFNGRLARSQRPFWRLLGLLFGGEGHFGAARYRVADAGLVAGGDLAVIGDGEGVLPVLVLVDGEDLGDEADADCVGLAGDGVDGDLHSADIRPRGPPVASAAVVGDRYGERRL